jgi:transcriptional regulator with PAS, ATPase and Fis domain
MVDEGKFREDLYYRLNVINLHLPPLRERSSDIPALATHFLEKYASENGKDLERFDDDALRILRNYDWPGNVRELENVIERAVVMADGPVVLQRHLPFELQQAGSVDTSVPRIPGSTLADIERHAILETLAMVGGSTTRAAQILGISVRKIQYRLHDYAEAPKGRAPALRASGSA